MERRDLVMINKKRRKKKRVCQFCADKNTKIDYKNYQKLEKFVTERGKILPRRITGTCAKHQRELTKAIKMARNIALLPYTVEEIYIVNITKVADNQRLFLYLQNV